MIPSDIPQANTSETQEFRIASEVFQGLLWKIFQRFLFNFVCQGFLKKIFRLVLKEIPHDFFRKSSKDYLRFSYRNWVNFSKKISGIILGIAQEILS